MSKRDQHSKQRLRGLIDTRYEGSQLDFSKASGLTEGRGFFVAQTPARHILFHLSLALSLDFFALVFSLC